MSGRRSFSATIISRSSSENNAPSGAPRNSRKAGTIIKALAGSGRPRSSLNSVLGNGNVANRSASEGSVTPFAKHGGKGSQTMEEFDSGANKENIPPFRLVSLTTPSTVRRRPTRFYSDTFTRPSSLDLQSPHIHVIKLASLSDAEDSDRESPKTSSTKGKEYSAMSSPTRLTKNTMILEKNGKVLLRVGKVVHASATSDNDSSDSDNSESDSDSGSEDHYGTLPGDVLLGEVDTSEEVPGDSKSDASREDSGGVAQKEGKEVDD